jgi:cellulose synthase/poly-beta-1,6-N-acetylglucosamine synthase-like glycosyltransferase
MTFQLFLFIVTILYVCQVCIFLIGLKRHRDQLLSPTNLTVSVIIAARNEEANLRDCLESVARQSYPVSLYEIIVVNDGSTDGTETICSRIC